MKIIPLKHQIDVYKFMLKEKNRGLLLFHSVGSGKTITSLLSAYYLSQKYPNKEIIIAAPKSLVNNFIKDIEKAQLTFKSKITITSHVKFINSLHGSTEPCKDKILIIDEAHNFGRNGTRSTALKKCAFRAFKVILLSATPVKNKPQEIVNLISMITGKQVDRSLVSAALEDYMSPAFKKLFKCNVSFYKNKNLKDYPKINETDIILRMPRSYYKEYYNIQEDIKNNIPELYLYTKDLQVFFNGIRRAVNVTSLVSPKIEWTMKKILEDISKNKKVLIYSAWKNTGINILKELLDNLNIKYGEITGDISKHDRDLTVNKFNDSKLKILLITSAGAEGLDLKGTRSVIILDPHWNKTRIDQVIGRAIRYKSHSHLPIKDRSVDIFHILLFKPKSKYTTDLMYSSDYILTELSKFKNIAITDFYKNLEKVSIERDSKCI